MQLLLQWVAHIPLLPDPLYEKGAANATLEKREDRSQFCNAKFAPRAATDPGRPTYSGSLLATRSAAHHVATVGIRSNLRNRSNSLSALARRMPFPANSRGR